jgi:hypothetical protein
MSAAVTKICSLTPETLEVTELEQTLQALYKRITKTTNHYLSRSVVLLFSNFYTFVVFDFICLIKNVNFLSWKDQDARLDLISKKAKRLVIMIKQFFTSIKNKCKNSVWKFFFLSFFSEIVRFYNFIVSNYDEPLKLVIFFSFFYILITFYLTIIFFKPSLMDLHYKRQKSNTYIQIPQDS